MNIRNVLEKIFVCSFVCSLVYSFVHSFVRSFVNLFVRSFARSFVRLLIYSFIDASVRPTVSSSIRLIVCLCNSSPTITFFVKCDGRLKPKFKSTKLNVNMSSGKNKRT